MAKFLTGAELESAISHIIWDAKDQLLIVSPFIKLDSYFKTIFERQLHNSRLHLVIVFGKNEHDRSKSLNSEDFSFFKQFPFVSIIYVHNLHAKYYGNEAKGIITSINMYDHSFKNNIEFGMYSENGLLDKLTKSSDQEAWDKSNEIAESGEPVFIKRPIFKKKLLMGKDFVNSSILLDNTELFFNQSYRAQSEKRKLHDFPLELDHESKTASMPTREETNAHAAPYGSRQQSYQSQSNVGYCIRTGVEIPFNPARPFSYEAYRTWAEFSNWDYSENFCHKTGRKSFGKTSMRNPVMH